MGIFEYLGVLISVIMGLGITHLVIGASKLVQNRDQCKPYVPHSLWAIAILVYILIIWWSMYWWSNHTNWSAFEFLFITLYALTLFFLSALLFPHDMDRDIDLEVYFFKQRRWFFYCRPYGYSHSWTLNREPRRALRTTDRLADYCFGLCRYIHIGHYCQLTQRFFLPSTAQGL